MFRKGIEPRCAYCRHSSHLDDKSAVCIHKGVTELSFSCSRFKYNPLKRIPQRPAKLETKKFSSDDFSL